jgi:hypothetical protein
MWTPFDRVIDYATAKAGRDAGKPGRDRAVQAANFMVEQALEPDLIPAGHEWPEARQIPVRAIGRRLANFLFRKGHKSRRVMEQLLLAHFASGVSIEEDYEGLGDWRIKITLRDTVQFAYFFWNWSIDDVPVSEQEWYAEKHLSQKELDIYRGSYTIHDVQIEHNIPVSINAAKTLSRVAALMMLTTEREMKRLYSRGNIFTHPGAFGAMSGFAGSMGAVVKGSMEVNDEAGSSETLADFIETQYDTIDSDVMDWRSQEALGLGWEDLLAQNKMADAIRPPSTPDDDEEAAA